jgi:hypothetical protein
MNMNTLPLYEYEYEYESQNYYVKIHIGGLPTSVGRQLKQYNLSYAAHISLLLPVIIINLRLRNLR